MLACLDSLTSGLVILLELEVVKLDGNVVGYSFFNKPGLLNKFTIGPLVVLLLLILLLLGCDDDEEDEEEDAEAVELVTGFDKLYVNEELDDGDEEEDDDEDDDDDSDV